MCVLKLLMSLTLHTLGCMEDFNLLSSNTLRCVEGLILLDSHAIGCIGVSIIYIGCMEGVALACLALYLGVWKTMTYVMVKDFLVSKRRVSLSDCSWHKFPSLVGLSSRAASSLITFMLGSNLVFCVNDFSLKILSSHFHNNDYFNCLRFFIQPYLLASFLSMINL